MHLARWLQEPLMANRRGDQWGNKNEETSISTSSQKVDHQKILFVRPAFCYGFLQIPPRDGHPCQLLMVPLIGPMKDFHSLELRPAGRTKKFSAYGAVKK